MISDQKKLKVLIVENEALLRLAAEDLLQELGHEVVGSANRASAAIAEAERAHPDLVLMDIQLDGARDGIDAAHHIREEFGIHSLFTTGMSDQETYRRALKAQPLGYLQKPLGLSELKSVLDPLASKQSEGTRQRRSASSSRGTGAKSTSREVGRTPSSDRSS
jgi:DNA-binding NarL/FixJ family response regulator